MTNNHTGGVYLKMANILGMSKRFWTYVVMRMIAMPWSNFKG